MHRLKNLFIFLAVLFNTDVFSHSFQVGHTTFTFTDSSRSNRMIATEIFYPTDSAGTDVPLAISSPDKFPVLGFGHGFVMTWDAYQNIWNAVVPEGFIIAFPKTEGTLSPSHTEFARDIAFVISELNRLGGDSSSLFYNRIDTMNCIMGHSMGGGSSFLGAQFSPFVKTLATLAPAETSPSAIQAAASLDIPSLIIAGGNDCVTPTTTNQDPMYDSLQSICKTLITINGGSHCQMADNNTLCSFGESTCTPQPAITRSEQHAVINRYLIPWLKYQLKNDCNAGALFDSLLASDTSIVFRKTCQLCNTTSVDEYFKINNIEVFPNPFNERLNIRCISNSIVSEVGIYFMDGRMIYSEKSPKISTDGTYEIATDKIKYPGIYLLEINVDGVKAIKKLVKE